MLLMKKPSLLIVDDDPVTADMIHQALEKERYDITVAHSGENAIDEGVKRKLDLVFTDLKMPDTGGLNVLEWFRK